METQTPWIELAQSEHGWQAIFACQICVQPFAEVQKYRWGFNAAALLTEALDRQKLFVEAQYHGNPLLEIDPEDHAIALRCIRIPGEGLLLALVGKVSAAKQDEAREYAINYCTELASIFPLDYKIYPAANVETFEKLTGKEIFSTCQMPNTVTQILRFETPIRTKKGLIYVNGFWQGAERSDEQIWRALGNYPQPALLNISLRPTRLENDERQVLWDMEQISIPSDSISPIHPAQPFDKWAETLINRRLVPWKRFYLLQVHILSPAGVTDSLVRSIGSAVTRETTDLFSPGFFARSPENTAIVAEWRQNLAKLEILPTHVNPSSLSRLSDIADLNEAHTVFRFPYPPEPGFPRVVFIDKLENHE